MDYKKKKDMYFQLRLIKLYEFLLELRLVKYSTTPKEGFGNIQSNMYKKKEGLL